jgi:hypothetical protein
MNWVGEPPAPIAPATQQPAQEAYPAAGLAEAVARKLDFDSAPTPDALAERWRDFLWRNHPDRLPPDARERANAKVALANALYDRARRARPDAR